ncbi:hypothetical protein [Rhizobium etli]|uniref:hypothetical protein n=1 Tax=Rhizobium etli TaxID=29449 RepID=UPI0005A0D20C|nr:hypothetical protein [Rhizobium etli]
MSEPASPYQGPIVSCLRLFLSVDLVGSTAFKQSSQVAQKLEDSNERDAVEPWFSPIAQFYKEIERLFAREWQSYVAGWGKKLNWPSGQSPELWKSAGDELLYTKVLSDHREALACIVCWKRAVSEYRQVLRTNHPSLDMKCTAWIAGFPLTNTEIVFKKHIDGLDDDDPVYVNLFLLHEYYRNSSNPDLTIDFIGPSIDTGFRLCALSDARKFIVSIDLVLMLVHAIRAKPVGANEVDLVFHYEGRKQLKGVIGDYPVFWIDMAADSGLDQIEDKLLRVEFSNTDDIKTFCELYFQSNSSGMIIPYIDGDQDGYFSNVPHGHKEKLIHLREYWVAESARRSDEVKSLADKGDGAEAKTEQVDGILKTIIKLLRDNTES